MLLLLLLFVGFTNIQRSNTLVFRKKILLLNNFKVELFCTNSRKVFSISSKNVGRVPISINRNFNAEKTYERKNSFTKNLERVTLVFLIKIFISFSTAALGGAYCAFNVFRCIISHRTP